MAREIELYWSTFDRYENCPRSYLWTYGDPNYDLGDGPGKPKPGAKKTSDHHRMMGHAIQKAIEKLYNEELWRQEEVRVNKDLLRRQLVEIAEEKLRYLYATGYVDGKAPSFQELLDIVTKGVEGYLVTMKAQKLLGSYSKAEVLVGGHLDKYTPIAGRVDVIIRRKDTGVTLLDGKNSAHRDKYTNPDQLLWYALGFRLAWGVVPDRLGFVYYRFPYGTPRENFEEPDPGVEWIPFTEDDLKELGKRARDVQKGIFYKKFDPNPKPAYYRWCPYEEACPERVEQRRLNSEKRRKKKDLFADQEGYVFEFSL